MNITFIGGGNMATALIRGLLNDQDAKGRLRVCDPSDEARAKLSTLDGLECFAKAADGLSGSNVVVLAIKPQVMPFVLADIQDVLEPGTLVISVAAGITIQTIREALGMATAVVRAMPNTPALLGAGVTGLFAGEGCSEAQKSAAERVMSAVGDVVWVEREELIDVVTAVSGSGPAYFYLLTEALAQAGAEYGLPTTVAMQLARSTVHGAGLMVEASEVEVSELRRRVTSPGGTTQAALESFTNGGFAELVQTAVAAAVNRGRELSGGASQ